MPCVFLVDDARRCFPELFLFNDRNRSAEYTCKQFGLRGGDVWL